MKCNLKWVEFVGLKVSHNPLVEIWRCPVCKQEREVSSYFSEEQPMEKISDLVHNRSNQQ